MTQHSKEPKQAWTTPRLEKLGDIKDIGGKPPFVNQGSKQS